MEREAPVIRAIREHVRVKPGGVVEVRRPDLPEGAEAEVIVMIGATLPEPPPLGTLVGKAQGCFKDADEADAFVRAEREQWDRRTIASGAASASMRSLG